MFRKTKNISENEYFYYDFKKKFLYSHWIIVFKNSKSLKILSIIYIYYTGTY